MIIKNYESLATSTARKQILRILEAGLEAINTENLMRQNFAYNKQEDALYINSKKFDISKFKKVVVVGAGKMWMEFWNKKYTTRRISLTTVTI
jgi:hypothetical protein